MKTDLRILAPFNGLPLTINPHHLIQSWKHEPCEQVTGFIIKKFINHHQDNIPNTAISIIVAKCGHHLNEKFLSYESKCTHSYICEKSKDNILKTEKP